MPSLPWPDVPVEGSLFRNPPREYGVLPFWFLNGELEPDEMRLQLREFRDKGMPGIILHGRYGLETPYIGPKYLDRIKLAVEEAEKLGLKTWIYDEMNWPSGTADHLVLQARPDLAQRYIECLSFPVRGPWFSYLTGEDSRYIDFERSTPIAAFAISSSGEILDLTRNLSFEKVIPWEAPPGNWRLMYIVEKRADYYIDALNPEATKEFLRIGYEPYMEAAGHKVPTQMPGFYTDEPAMHYYVTGGDNPIVPWTKDMFRRFQEHKGYNLRRCLPHLFFDISPDSARIRYDFYNTLTDFYSDTYYRQIHEWCQQHDVLFTGHLLYEEWLRKMIRVEGNLFKHYEHLDVMGVDHLYPFIGNRDRPDEHVAMKVASSAAHQYGSERLLCESFGGIFMDATMQRMKWIADWEYVLGVNLLNPHGFHYTLEGPRKRDWPPSMFYQYPWWHYYSHFSDYISRTSSMLTGGRHVAKVAMLWPINAMFGTYIPQTHTPLGDRTEGDFNALTDLLLRLHHDFDYLDEDVLAGAEISNGTVRIRDEEYELLILPPMAHIKLNTVEVLERFVQAGGKLLGGVFLPDQAYGPNGLVDVSDRIEALFGVNPAESRRTYQQHTGIDTVVHEHDSGGRVAFLHSYALARPLPLRLQGESQSFAVEPEWDSSRYFYAPPGKEREDVTVELAAERATVSRALGKVLGTLIVPDVVIDNQEVFYLHRIKEGRDIYFLVNTTYSEQKTQISLPGDVQPVLWDPSSGEEHSIVPTQLVKGNTSFDLVLPPVGSAFILTIPSAVRITEANIHVDTVSQEQVSGYGAVSEAHLTYELNGQRHTLTSQAGGLSYPLLLDGEWEFRTEDANALVIENWLATAQAQGTPEEVYTAPDADTSEWLPMTMGAWSYQLPAEPNEPYPIDVWYRINFRAEHVPARLDLIVDGFAGADWKLYVNGQSSTTTPVRSAFDSQMKAVNISDLVQTGENVVALCLTVRNTTDGLLDLVKITGDFSLALERDGSYSITEPRQTAQPQSWTTQGYPFYSGRAVYRKTFEWSPDFEGQRVFVEPAMADDVLEVIINGTSAAVRLWAPYGAELTEYLRPGENTLELRVANTLVNMLERTDRPSGLAGAPRIVFYRSFSFALAQ